MKLQVVISFQEQQMNQVTQQIENDPNSKLALAQQTLEAAEQILAQDPNNQDALAAKASAEKVIAEYQTTAQPAAQAQTQQHFSKIPAQQGGFATTMSGVPVVPGFNGFGYDMNQYRQAMQTASMPFANNYQAMANTQIANPAANPFMPQQTQQKAQ